MALARQGVVSEPIGSNRGELNPIIGCALEEVAGKSRTAHQWVNSFQG